MTIFEPVLLAVRQGNRAAAISGYMTLAGCFEAEATRIVDASIKIYKQEQRINRKIEALKIVQAFIAPDGYKTTLVDPLYLAYLRAFLISTSTLGLDPKKLIEKELEITKESLKREEEDNERNTITNRNSTSS